MKKFIKFLLFGVLTVSISCLAVSCYGEDIEELQNKTTALEQQIKALEDASEDLTQLKADVAAAKAAAQAAQNTADEAKKLAEEAKEAAADAKTEAIEEAQKMIDELRTELKKYTDDEIAKAMTEVNAKLTALGLRLDQVEDDVVSNMIATLQLQKRVLEIFVPGNTWITTIEGYISKLKAGTIGVKDVDLDGLAAALAAIDPNILLLQLGRITSIELFPSLSHYASNILINGLRAMTAAGNGTIDWDRDAEDLLNDFFSWNPSLYELTGNLLVSFAATTGAVDYKFGEGKVDGFIPADNYVEFKYGDIVRPTKTSFVIKVNPANANLAAADNKLMFVRSGDGNIDVNDYLEFGTPVPYTDPYVRASVQTGLWEVPVSLKEGVSINGLDRLVTLYTNGVPEKLNDNIDDGGYLDDIPDEYLYRKYMYGFGVTKKTDNDSYTEADLKENLVISKYEIGLYTLGLEPVYNRHDVDANGQTIRVDDFKFSVYTEINSIKSSAKHVAIHNRFEDVENPGPTTPKVPMELRWVNGKANATVYDNQYYNWANIGSLPARVEPDGEQYGVNATPAITVKTDYNPYDAVNGPSHGDNRQLQDLFKVQAGTEFTINIDNPALVSHYYVTLDEKWALESQPSELNAWNTYQYTGKTVTDLGETYETGLKKVVPAHIPTTLTITEKDPLWPVEKDIIGFRVYIVNYDGTLVDPDGKSFYVLVAGQNAGGNIETTVVWPTTPYYVTKNGHGNNGSGSTSADPELNDVYVATDYVSTDRALFSVTTGNITKASLDASDIRYELTVSYEGDATYWIPGNQVPASSIVRYTGATGTTTASTWASTNYIGFKDINPRGIKNDGSITGVITFYKQIYDQSHMLQDEYIYAQWTITINKNMPKFPEDVDYKTDILRGEAYVSGGDMYGTPNKVLWAYPTRMYDATTLTPNAPFAQGIGNSTAGNYSFFSGIWFGSLANPNYYGLIEAVNGAHFAGFKFTNRTITPLSSKYVYPYYDSADSYKHEIRVYTEEIGLNDPVDRQTNGDPLSGKPEADIYTNQEVGSNYDFVLSTHRANRQMETYQANLEFGYGYISWASGNVRVPQRYWVGADNSDSTVALTEKQYPILLRFRSFIQDLQVTSWTNQPTLIYNALVADWKTTKTNHVKVQSLTGNEFNLSYLNPATYVSDIPREYIVVNVTIWTGTNYERPNEYFEPKVPYNTDYPIGYTDEIVWVPINQQDTPGTIQGKVSLDIMDEFGHVYRVYMPNMITMQRAE